jgi:hypothetical protein
MATTRFTPLFSGECQQFVGGFADRARVQEHSGDAPQGVGDRVRLRWVALDDLDSGRQACGLRVTGYRSDVGARGAEQVDQGPTDGAGRSSYKDHDVSFPVCGNLCLASAPQRCPALLLLTSR